MIDLIARRREMMGASGGIPDPWAIGESRTQDDFVWYTNRICQTNNNSPTSTPPYTVFSTHYRATDFIDIEGSHEFHIDSVETRDIGYNVWRDNDGLYISSFKRTPNTNVIVPAGAKYMQLSQGKDSGRDLNITITRIS